MTAPTPFSTLLIANRGEIAARIIRSAHAAGIETVAVFAPAEADAPHVAMASRSVALTSKGEPYLDIAAIIDAARRSGAQAIHPGYGFLAENPALAEACAKAGIIFVGPSAQALRTMGDKAAAKAAMVAAGVPCIPGYAGDDQSQARLAAEAAAIGFPVMIKAAAGGGGRGMRLVTQAQDFPGALSAAKAEAVAAFGSDAMLLERAMTGARHVEIQILADRNGHTIHLGERDCSIQRRHQKLIEEAPSPAVDAALRARMGALCVRAAQEIGYEGAGTFEFLLEANGDFWFLEMNTRLQVEHGVTEAVTGLDLVALQLRIAAGAPLGLTQDDVHLSGHAIEVRLCAEDAENGFLPQAGRVALWRPAPGLRVDHALADGVAVPPQYDSMVAKLVAQGVNRAEALARLRAGLDRTRLMGLRSNQPFLAACLAHPEFGNGRATTDFVPRFGDELAQTVAAGEARAAMILGGVLRAAPQTRLAPRFAAPLRLGRNGRIHAPTVVPGPLGLAHVTMVAQAPIEMRVHSGSGTDLVVELNGCRAEVSLVQADGRVAINLDGRTWDFEDLTLQAERRADEAGDGRLRAAMAGTVRAVDVAVGDTVTAGQRLLVLEAMKMEHAHLAPVSGQVTALYAGTDEPVPGGKVLVEIDAGDQAASAP